MMPSALLCVIFLSCRLPMLVFADRGCSGFNKRVSNSRSQKGQGAARRTHAGSTPRSFRTQGGIRPKHWSRPSSCSHHCGVADGQCQPVHSRCTKLAGRGTPLGAAAVAAALLVAPSAHAIAAKVCRHSSWRRPCCKARRLQKQQSPRCCSRCARHRPGADRDCSKAARHSCQHIDCRLPAAAETSVRIVAAAAAIDAEAEPGATARRPDDLSSAAIPHPAGTKHSRSISGPA